MTTNTCYTSPPRTHRTCTPLPQTPPPQLHAHTQHIYTCTTSATLGVATLYIMPTAMCALVIGHHRLLILASQVIWLVPLVKHETNLPQVKEDKGRRTHRKVLVSHVTSTIGCVYVRIKLAIGRVTCHAIRQIVTSHQLSDMYSMSHTTATVTITPRCVT